MAKHVLDESDLAYVCEKLFGKTEEEKKDPKAVQRRSNARSQLKRAMEPLQAAGMDESAIRDLLVEYKGRSL